MKKNKKNQLTTSDIWLAFFKKYPERYSQSEKVADASSELMCKQLQVFKKGSLEEICYWCQMAEFINSCLAQISDSGALDNAIAELGLN